MKTPVSKTPNAAQATLDASRIRAISIDLDDTLWPIWPTIERAEKTLAKGLIKHAPATARLYANPTALRLARIRLQAARPDLAGDLSALRRESIRYVLELAGEDPSLAEPAFDVFFDERQRVKLFKDAVPALEWLSIRFPVVAVSNGNADVHRIGLGHHFHAAFSAREFGVGKPDPRIFHAAAAAAGVDASEVLHIGDDPHLDVVGGLGAGMQVAWVNRTGAAWQHTPQQPTTTVANLMDLCRQIG